ncbi:MAG: extracellular solute-binding protein, partial [Chloroflexi bacterium]|nr:extracellular solute-binding protein [Chloroflexota bacterium]
MTNQKSVSRRRFLKLFGAAAGAGLLAACQPKVVEVEKEVTKVVKEVVKETVVVQGTPQIVEKVVEKVITAPPPQPVKQKELSFWMWNTYAPAADNVMELSIRRWAQDNEVKINISRDSDGKMRDKIMPALEAGTLPDLMFAGQGEAVLMWNAKGIDPVTDLFKEIGDTHGGWMTRLPEYTIREGVAYFLPYSIDTPMMHFRQDIFDKAGIKVPEGQWTWEETRDLAKQAMDFTEKEGKKLIGWGFGVVKQQHDGWCSDVFRNHAAFVWDETGKKVVLKDQNQDKAVAALNFMKSAWDLGLFPADAGSWDWASNNKSYQEEQCILVINAASIYTWCQKNKPELAEATGLAPKPKAVLDTTDASLRYVVVLPKVSKDKALASDLARALYMKDIYAPWLAEGFVTNVVREYDTLEMWQGKRAAFNLAATRGVYPGFPAPYDNAAMAEAGGPNDPIGSMTVRVLIDGWDPIRA